MIPRILIQTPVQHPTLFRDIETNVRIILENYIGYTETDNRSKVLYINALIMNMIDNMKVTFPDMYRELDTFKCSILITDRSWCFFNFNVICKTDNSRMFTCSYQ